ncbi:hypothetical protein CRG98_030598 [Punica granatum]|uniref:Neurochondrin n=1 Tax=Punica granatum TaxID=22663 RepID=A0A2I0IYF2_PUNGR|nr:hypothetical protein CRG98_030598 [Punica granatum]
MLKSGTCAANIRDKIDSTRLLLLRPSLASRAAASALTPAPAPSLAPSVPGPTRLAQGSSSTVASPALSGVEEHRPVLLHRRQKNHCLLLISVSLEVPSRTLIPMSQQQEQSPSLDDCLKLLKGERDEQRLAGLLLLTKFCRGDDHASIRRAYDAVGSQFLDRLLRTGMRKGPNGGSDNDNRDAYLQLSVTVLATLCRVPEIASSKEMVSKIPVVLEVMSKESVSPVLEECYEFLYLTSSTNEDGVTTLFESDGIRILASPISTFTDGSHLMELSMKLVQLMLSKVSLGIITDACLVEMSTIVAAIIRQFAMLHNALKFDALHLLSAIFSSDYSGPLKEELGRKTNNHWPDYLLIGVVAILQNRVGM